MSYYISLAGFVAGMLIPGIFKASGKEITYFFKLLAITSITSIITWLMIVKDSSFTTVSSMGIFFIVSASIGLAGANALKKYLYKKVYHVSLLVSIPIIIITAYNFIADFPQYAFLLRNSIYAIIFALIAYFAATKKNKLSKEIILYQAYSIIMALFSCYGIYVLIAKEPSLLDYLLAGYYGSYIFSLWIASEMIGKRRNYKKPILSRIFFNPSKTNRQENNYLQETNKDMKFFKSLYEYKTRKISYLVALTAAAILIISPSYTTAALVMGVTTVIAPYTAKKDIAKTIIPDNI